jgi:hypothetical protein
MGGDWCDWAGAFQYGMSPLGFILASNVERLPFYFASHFNPTVPATPHGKI